MSALPERATSSASPGVSAIPGLALPPGTLPQVNLLPVTVRAKRALRRLKQVLALVLVLVLLGLGLGYLAVSHALDAERSRLESAQVETTRLMKQRAQFSEAPRVLAQVNALKSARAQGMSTEVDWTSYLHSVFAVLPTGVTLSDVAMSGATPMVPPPAPGNVLQGPSVGTLSFTVRSPSLIDTAGWVDALNGVPGFADAWVSDIAAGADEVTGETYFTVSSTVQVTADAYADRFTVEGQ